MVLYAPGWARLSTDQEARGVERALAQTGSPGGGLAGELVRRGRAASRAWEDLATRPFEPECLTLYLSNRCNLACRYCYSAPEEEARAGLRVLGDASFPVLSEAAVAAAARRVAAWCAAKGRPLTLVLHGGGEPTLHWELLGRVRSICLREAELAGVGLWSYIATHGVLAESRVRWLARNFDLIGLSCDGPPDIQAANRPAASGGDTSRAVERTAGILNGENAAFSVRATITPETTARQADIVEYFHAVLRARTIRFEPAYSGRRRNGDRFRTADADSFVKHFLEAETTAKRRGCDLQISGVRLDEIHGPFCTPLRDVLQVTPDGKASACFLSTGSGDAADEAMATGGFNRNTGEFEVDTRRAAAARLQAARIPVRCRECHNVHHCARECPDVCLLTDDADEGASEGFRCRVQKLWSRHVIFEMAAAAMNEQEGEVWQQRAAEAFSDSH